MAQANNDEKKTTGTTEPPEQDMFLQFIREQGLPLFLGIGVAVLVYLGIMAYRGHKASLARQAANKLAMAQKVEQLQEIVAHYPKTPSAAVALFSMGTAFFDDGQYALAQQNFRQFRERYPDHVMVPAAELAQNYCLEAQGRLEEALRGFRSFAESHPEHFVTPLAVLGQGRCLEQMGRPEEARTIYEDYIAEHPEGQWTPLAETALLYVKQEIRARGMKSAGKAVKPDAAAGEFLNPSK